MYCLQHSLSAGGRLAHTAEISAHKYVVMFPEDSRICRLRRPYIILATSGGSSQSADLGLCHAQLGVDRVQLGLGGSGSGSGGVGGGVRHKGGAAGGRRSASWHQYRILY